MNPRHVAAARVYLATLVIANLFYCTHSYLSFLCERKSSEDFFFLALFFVSNTNVQEVPSVLVQAA